MLIDKSCRFESSKQFPSRNLRNFASSWFMQFSRRPEIKARHPCMIDSLENVNRAPMRQKAT
jgi:hypothetical protein